jgi:CheY-like chemotaxis protein
MDMQMPKNGWSGDSEAYQETAAVCRIGGIAMTANVLTDEREQGFAADMSDFISKPVAAQLLYATLLKWLAGGGAGGYE